MSDLSIDIEDINSKHNGKPIAEIEISPSGKYLVTYSEKDNSFVGWNVDDDIDEGQLKPVNVYRDTEKYHKVTQIRASDSKKLAYLDDHHDLKIIDMEHKMNQEIKLYFDKGLKPDYCTFNLNDKFILYNRNRIIFIYSTQTTKNNKWNCIKIHELPNEDFNLISISKYDKIYFSLSNEYIYEWDIFTEKSIKIFGNDEIKKYIKSYKLLTYNCKFHDIKISSNRKFICLKINDKIIIHSVELKIPIVFLDINNDIQHLMNDLDSEDLYYLLLTLFNNKQIKNSVTWNSIMGYCWKECLGRLKQPPKEYKTEKLPILFDNTTKFIFGILGGYVWKIKLEERISKMNLSFENHDELNNKNDKIIESWNMYLDGVPPVPGNDNEYEFNHLFNTYRYLDTVKELFRKTILDKGHNRRSVLELISDSINIKLQVNIDREKIQLRVFKKNVVNSKSWDLIREKNDNHNLEKNSYYAYGIELCNDNDIVILTTVGLFIYHFNESRKSISLNYFYNMNSRISNYEKVFLKSIPLSNYDSFKFNGWVSTIKDDKLSLLKYGVELFSFAIKEHKLELIDDIYKKCINYFKQDLENNRMLLSIITSTMPILNEYYPEYILRYSLETTMIVDSPSYNIEHQSNDLHLHSFSQRPQIVNLSWSILWTKYAYLFKYKYMKDNHETMFIILKYIQLLIALLTFPIYFPTFYILSKFHFINNIYENYFSYIYFKILDKISSKFSKHTKTPTITFMIPYIKFVNYPQDYNRNWFWEFIKPHSSPFVETISRDIYKTWSGEALINFKWNTYGKYYYAIIWTMFMALFGCFTIAATITLADDVRNKLLIASIIFGSIHLITKVRQIIYDPKKWIYDLFDIIVYLFPICASIYWIQTNNMTTWLPSFSCLFLYIKLVMFFRVFESFGIYFAIIISVGKQIISFLAVLLIIIIGFAHAFYILLLPRSDNDPNSPLKLTNTYNKVLDNGTIDNSNPFMIQSPDDNTNMFVDYKTSVLAMYLFLTGDSSSLTNWSYKENPPLVILIVLFSFLVVVYLMNLFIGLLNIAIGQDNNRVSYLIEKAKILAEIELLYLLPNQRRWQAWFPDTIYYYANVDKTREKINEMINKEEWKTNDFLLMKRDLLRKLNIHDNFDN